MSNLRTAAQELVNQWESNTAYPVGALVDALRTALAITEQTNQCGETCERASLCATCARGLEDAQPVAWRVFDGEGGYDYVTYADNEKYAEEFASRNPRWAHWVEALYTK